MNRQPLHTIPLSIWPYYASIISLSLAVLTVLGIHTSNWYPILVPITVLTWVVIMWFNDIITESTYLGFHTSTVANAHRIVLILFIISEVMLLFSWLWAFLHSSLVPSTQGGCIWPPVGIEPVSPLGLPMLNTALLLSSGAFATWAHQATAQGNFNESSLALNIVVAIGLTFLLLQSFEYVHAPLTIADGVYGSTFYITTGLHGVHVLVGSVLILTCANRIDNLQLSPKHHVSLEAAIWYWHLVDVVWIFLLALMYVWGYSL